MASNGARTDVIDQFWLGNLRTPSVSAEEDAKLVDRDELDDGLELVTRAGDGTRLSFRAVRSAVSPAGTVFFNLLVDLAPDGRWQGSDWVVQNREVDLAPGTEELLEANAGVLPPETWLRAALTDSAVTADPAVGWDGGGHFAAGEIEDYHFAGPAPTPSPTPSPPYPTYTPTPTPNPSATPTPSPTFIPTGDFVVVCDPAQGAILHGESLTIGLNIVSGLHTPPERFRATASGPSAAILGISPGADAEGWSAWQDGATLTFISGQVDPPARTEHFVVSIVLQSPSTTRLLECYVDVTHTEPPAIEMLPPLILVPPLTGTTGKLQGTGFTPSGDVDLLFTFPSGEEGHVSVAADADGLVAFVIQFTPDAHRGDWHVVATDLATGLTAEATFEVR